MPFIILFLLLIFWGVCRAFSEPKIVAIYKKADSFKDTMFIVLENAPSSNQAILTFWDSNREYLKTKYNIDLGYAKSLIFLQNSYKNYNKDTEDQFCFDKEIKQGRVCIDKSSTLLIISKFDDGVFSYGFSQPNCSFIETVEVGRSALTCY